MRAVSMRITHLSAIGADADVPRGGVATLGVFDGVHLGHQQILGHVIERARAVAGPSVVLTFAVHPVVVIKGLPPRLITSLPHRLRLFERAGIDHCVVLPFDDDVRQLSAATFAEEVFVELLGARELVLGPDARVGRRREGDIAFLRGFCDERDIGLHVVDDLRHDGKRVSSTRIRAAIADGDLARARDMLGRDVSLLGTVVEGDGRGRTLGFATANLDLHHEIRPPSGVYAIRAHVDGRALPGVANIGVRPTFGPDGDLTVEAHLLDFDGDLYGKDVELDLVDRIREEMRFESRDQLVRQIERDVASARAVLRAR